ncbi:uncharacterized protein DUF58 [Breoghania corrubedonensis]|uniref:Uncharacterized protein DUF58 n=1 Tax=Breoghania corrubedonensis TaxID=665038 RepID=A0A2T5UU23_9HYPH|nr:DUF58 domain-containing protein [Breoghania corrubedonensis]PTW54978.1 uncharacterized protein DUF58 [Breoghania corrubedonensis]
MQPTPEPDMPSQEALLNVIGEARSLSEALPDLLVEAKHIANTVAAGWHGRRRAGPGETFWQFRPFNMGEPVKRIDWRRSARDDHLFVREREWEAAHTIWLWPDLSPSMSFRSRLAAASKRDRALVILLGLADLLARGGERIGLTGLTRPLSHRNAAEKLAAALSHSSPRISLPDTHSIGRFSEVVLIGDLLDPVGETATWVQRVVASGARGHLVQVMDPVEETFPFAGRTEFRDPETGARLTAGRAESWRDAYQQRLIRHRTELSELARKAGWTFLVHHTDRPANEPLLALHARLADNADAAPRKPAMARGA